MISPHSFQWQIRVPLSDVANRVNVDEETVRSRLRKLNARGSFRRWELVVNPSLLDLRVARVEAKADDNSSKERLVSGLKLIEGVKWIFDYHGDLTAAVIFYDGDAALKRRLDSIQFITGNSPTWWKVPLPPCTAKLSKTDWQIVRDLRRNPRKSYTSIARELGISTRTARRRVKAMSESRAFFLDPVLDLSRLKEGLPCDVRVRYVDGRDRRRLHQSVLARLKNVVWANGDSEVSIFMVLCENAAEIEGVSKALKAINGVDSVRADIQANRFTVDDWFDEQIEKHTTLAADHSP